jgi:putative transposase
MYPSDLTEKQWRIIEPLVARPDPRGAVAVYPRRDVINAILYLNKTGCQWRLLPSNFPPWQGVYNHFQRMQKRGVWELVCRELNKSTRQKGGVRRRQATC